MVQDVDYEAATVPGLIRITLWTSNFHFVIFAYSVWLEADNCNQAWHSRERSTCLINLIYIV